jgi:hypothetical protein
MKSKIFKFKTIKEAENFKWHNIIKEGLPYWKFDRYEYARLHITFEPGVYRFKTLKEKRDWEFEQVCKKWTRQG